MKPRFGLTDGAFNTQYAPLCVVGQALRERKSLEALKNFGLIKQKICRHSPGEKIMDALLLILAGYPSLYLLNHHLRPDQSLSQAWGRPILAEQSSISRLLDAFEPTSLDELSQISWQFWSEHSRLSQHDWRKTLLVDLDLTPLLASEKAEASTKGYLGKKTSPVAS